MKMKVRILFLCLTALLVSCITITIERFDSFSDEGFSEKSGIFSILSEDEFDIYYTDCNIPYVKAKLICDGEEKELYFGLDTGCGANLIDSNVVNSFSNPKKDIYRFMGTLLYAPEAKLGHDSYRFDKLKFGTAVVDDILFQSTPLKGLMDYYTEDGSKLDGIIGMDVLQKCPFAFYPVRKKMCFTKKSPEWSNSVEIPIKEYKWNTVIIPMVLNGKEELVDIDTGAGSCLFRPKDYKKQKKENMYFYYGLKSKYFKTEVGYFKELEFCGHKIKKLQVVKSAPFKAYSTIGSSILYNFNFYIDVKNRVTKFQYIEDEEAKSELIPQEIDDIDWYRLGSIRKTLFGFVIDVKKGRRYITSLYYSNGKAMLPEVKYGDELISIDGIPQFVYPWTKWNNLQEADFVFKRGKKEFTVHAKRKSLYLENEE